MALEHGWRSIAVVLCAGALVACASADADEKTGPRTIVSTDAFADPAIVRTPTEVPAYPNAAPMHTPTTPTTELIAVAGAPSLPVGAPVPVITPKERVVVDEMVGQINGEPIYAEEFFRDMDARLRVESTQKQMRQWIRDVREDVEGKVWDVMRDELLLAEFRSTLTPEMKVGVQYFIQDLQRQLTSEAGGSTEQANEQFLSAEGMTLNEKVKDVSQRQFVLQQLRKAIGNRVYVTSRDIETYYDQNYDKFHPPAIAVFAVIRVPLSDPGRIRRVESRLTGGDAFIEIAAVESEWAKEPQNPEEKNQLRVVMQTEVFEEQKFWEVPELNTLTQQLSLGETSDRLDVRGSAWWVFFAETVQPPSRTLYEAQLEIEQIIKGERMRREEQRYFERLLAKSNVSDMQTMITRLVEYAAVRYYVRPGTVPPVSPAAPTPSAPSTPSAPGAK